MVSMPVLVLRIGTTMFGTRIGTLVVVSLVRIFKNNALNNSYGFIGATYKYGQLVCPALANTLKRSVKVRVMKMKLQDSIQKGH